MGFSWIWKEKQTAIENQPVTCLLYSRMPLMLLLTKKSFNCEMYIAIVNNVTIIHFIILGRLLIDIILRLGMRMIKTKGVQISRV